ncbi:transferase [Kitasatospora sp. NPDC002227]|uniref:transferase n=1 Tax=Kitasatospora sp. NPDC002227 TaxID=3154773 RepID=UPI0033208A1E
MSSRLRAFARLITVLAVIAVYVAAQLTVTAGTDLRAALRFHGAGSRADAFTAALDRHADGQTSARTGIAEGNAWFAGHAPSGSRSMVSAAAAEAEQGRTASARRQVAGLSGQIARDRARLDQRLGSSSATALYAAVPAVVLLGPALWLRRRRRSAAADVAALVSRFVPDRRPWWWRPLFLTADGAGCMLFTAGCFAASAAQRRGDRMPPEALVGSLVGGLLAIGAAVVVLRATRPRAARGAAQELLADGRRPVLFLRSFDDDQAAAQVEDAADLHIHSREEQLVAALRAVGPVIAVSPPVRDGEPLPLPQLGAARFYLPREPRDGWQQPVLDLMELSQLIVLRLGLGEGLWWEYGQARAGHPTQKLVVLVPGGLPGLDEQMAEHQLPLVRPVEAGDGDAWISAVITFDPDRTPRVHPVGQSPDGKSWLVRAWAVLSLRAGALDRSSSTAHIAVTLQRALRSVGIRRRWLAVRAGAAQQKAMGDGVRLVTVLLLLLWLGVRTLQLLGLRIVL